MKRIEDRIALVRALHVTLHGAVPTVSCDGVERLACFLVREMARAGEEAERAVRRSRWRVSTSSGGVS